MIASYLSFKVVFESHESETKEDIKYKEISHKKTNLFYQTI